MRRYSLLDLQAQMDRVFREARAWQRSPAAEPHFAPPTDVSRDEDAYHIRVDLPGVRREDLRVQVDGGAVSIRGHREAPGDAAGRQVRSERHHGVFSRVIALPSDADYGRVNARLRDGVLEVTVARTARRPTGRVEIAVE